MRRVSWKKPASDPAAAPTDEQLWAALLRWQTRREHAQAELQRKLAQRQATPAQAERLLARLQALGLQSDDRYAEGLVRSQLQRGRAARAIHQRLQQAGIAADDESVQAQLAEVDWVARAVALLQRRFGESLAQDDKARARYLRFLQYRGYSLPQSLAALRQAGTAPGDDSSPQD